MFLALANNQFSCSISALALAELPIIHLGVVRDNRALFLLSVFNLIGVLTVVIGAFPFYLVSGGV